MTTLEKIDRMWREAHIKGEELKEVEVSHEQFWEIMDIARDRVFVDTTPDGLGLRYKGIAIREALPSPHTQLWKDVDEVSKGFIP